MMHGGLSEFNAGALNWQTNWHLDCLGNIITF